MGIELDGWMRREKASRRRQRRNEGETTTHTHTHKEITEAKQMDGGCFLSLIRLFFPFPVVTLYHLSFSDCLSVC